MSNAFFFLILCSCFFPCIMLPERSKTDVGRPEGGHKVLTSIICITYSLSFIFSFAAEHSQMGLIINNFFHVGKPWISVRPGDIVANLSDRSLMLGDLRPGFLDLRGLPGFAFLFLFFLY